MTNFSKIKWKAEKLRAAVVATQLGIYYELGEL